MDKYITSSNKEDWGTPQWFFDKLDQEFHSYEKALRIIEILETASP